MLDTNCIDYLLNLYGFIITHLVLSWRTQLMNRVYWTFHCFVKLLPSEVCETSLGVLLHTIHKKTPSSKNQQNIISKLVFTKCHKTFSKQNKKIYITNKQFCNLDAALSQCDFLVYTLFSPWAESLTFQTPGSGD